MTDDINTDHLETASWQSCTTLCSSCRNPHRIMDPCKGTLGMCASIRLRDKIIPAPPWGQLGQLPQEQIVSLENGRLCPARHLNVRVYAFTYFCATVSSWDFTSRDPGESAEHWRMPTLHIWITWLNTMKRGNKGRAASCQVHWLENTNCSRKCRNSWHYGWWCLFLLEVPWMLWPDNGLSSASWHVDLVSTLILTCKKIMTLAKCVDIGRVSQWQVSIAECRSNCFASRRSWVLFPGR